VELNFWVVRDALPNLGLGDCPGHRVGGFTATDLTFANAELALARELFALLAKAHPANNGQ
jgi:hypothetical protein